MRPQDLERCFGDDEDTWYFPRVAGTFKERAGFHGSYPAFRYRRYTVWGLTYRILEKFVGILGRSLPSYQRRELGDQESD